AAAGCLFLLLPVGAGGAAVRSGLSGRQGPCRLSPTRRRAHIAPAGFLHRRPRRGRRIPPDHPRSATLPDLLSEAGADRSLDDLRAFLAPVGVADQALVE